MFDWNRLPPEIKQHVVKKLNLMSRQSLKSSSYYCRQLVTSTKLYIPRVRIEMGGSNEVMMMIYTGIDRFLRFELYGSNKGTLMLKSENSWNPRELSPKVVYLMNSLQLAISILFTLLADKSITIGHMELDITPSGDKEIEKNSKKLLKIIGDRKLHVENMSIPLGRDMTTSYGFTFFVGICPFDKFRNFDNFRVNVSSNNLSPVMILHLETHSGELPNFPVMSENLPVMNYTEYCLAAAKPEELENFEEKFKIKESVNDNDNQNHHIATYFEVNQDSKNGGNGPDKPPTIKYREDDPVVYRTVTTKCGQWTHMYFKEKEKEFMDLYESQKCGLGVLCKRCSDPFDYWYYQNLTRRLYYEPSFRGSIWALRRNAITENEIDELISKIGREVKQKDRNLFQKARRKKNQKSWGFTKLPDIRIEKNGDITVTSGNQKVRMSGIEATSENIHHAILGAELCFHFEELQKAGTTKWNWRKICWYMVPILIAYWLYRIIF